jgi:hypothetical protein
VAEGKRCAGRRRDRFVDLRVNDGELVAFITVMEPSCVAFLRHVVPGPLRVRVPECEPVMVLVRAPVAEASVRAMSSIPDTAATARVPVRVARAIYGMRQKMCVMSLLLTFLKSAIRDDKATQRSFRS